MQATGKIEVSELANITGRKWGPSALGTPGGTVTWSLAAAGEDISRFNVATQISTTGATFLNYDFAQVIADAFAEWSKHGDIEFQQIADQGGAAGVGRDADIRIFFGAIPGGTVGYAFYPSPYSAIGGDILLDTLSRFNTDPLLFASIVLHEIGHAIGLGHVDGSSIMTPKIRKIGLQQDDIEGIIEIYGAQDAPAPEPGPQPVPEPNAPTLSGDDGNNRLVGTSDADIIAGAGGNDALIGANGADTIMGGEGRDSIYGGRGFDVISGGDGNDLLRGHGGHDQLQGDTGADKLLSGRGNDLLTGGGGNDTLNGSAGSDTLIGGSGDDTLKGGKWADSFVFADDHGHDKILDFNVVNTQERINLTDLTTLNSFADVANAATQVNGNVLINTGADSSILLRKVSLSDLGADDFLF